MYSYVTKLKTINVKTIVRNYKQFFGAEDFETNFSYIFVSLNLNMKSVSLSTITSTFLR